MTRFEHAPQERIDDHPELLAEVLARNRPSSARPARRKLLKRLERETGIEPATSSLGSLLSPKHRSKRGPNLRVFSGIPHVTWLPLVAVGQLVKVVGHTFGHTLRRSE